MKKERNKNPVQPISGTKVPRFAGPSTFARLPELRDVESCDVAIVGIPFDAGTSYRPGARFGPMSIRQASRHLRTNYHPSYDVEPFKVQQVADAGDITCNPFNIDEAIKQIEEGATELLSKVGGIISLGGDHTIALPLLRAINKMNNGPVALVHFDATLSLSLFLFYNYISFQLLPYCRSQTHTQQSLLNSWLKVTHTHPLP